MGSGTTTTASDCCRTICAIAPLSSSRTLATTRSGTTSNVAHALWAADHRAAYDGLRWFSSTSLRRARRRSARGDDYLHVLPHQVGCEDPQAVHVATSVDHSILDVPSLQPAETVHCLGEGRAQMGASGF